MIDYGLIDGTGVRRVLLTLVIQIRRLFFK